MKLSRYIRSHVDLRLSSCGGPAAHLSRKTFVKALKSIASIGIAIVFGVVAPTLSGNFAASAAAPDMPPDATFCVPFLNNLQALGINDIVGNLPTTATVSTGASVVTNLSSGVRALVALGKNLSFAAADAPTPISNATIEATASELRTEIAHVQAYIKSVRSMTATKNPAILKMANADVAVDANRSCVVWGQQLIIGFVTAQETLNKAPRGVTPMELRIQAQSYGSRVTFIILSATPTSGSLKSAKVAISESKYTVDVCLDFSAKPLAAAIC
jgi:hypothetical protein